MDNGAFKHDADRELDLLIKGLTVDLKGTLYFDTNKGTKIRIKFMHDLLNLILNQFIEFKNGIVIK
nr:hypothetical protein [Mucilaginibacter sp. FT3.2]